MRTASQTPMKGMHVTLLFQITLMLVSFIVCQTQDSLSTEKQAAY